MSVKKIEINILLIFMPEGYKKYKRVIQKTLNIAHMAGINKFNPNGNTVFFAVDGFNNEFIAGVMKDVLEYCAEND